MIGEIASWETPGDRSVGIIVRCSAEWARLLVDAPKRFTRCVDFEIFADTRPDFFHALVAVGFMPICLSQTHAVWWVV